MRIGEVDRKPEETTPEYIKRIRHAHNWRATDYIEYQIVQEATTLRYRLELVAESKAIIELLESILERESRAGILSKK